MSGIKGMKWYVRRYQNPDGTLTPAGKVRYQKSSGELTMNGTASLKNEIMRVRDGKKSSYGTKNRENVLADMHKSSVNLRNDIKGMSIEQAIEYGRARMDKLDEDFARATLKDMGLSDSPQALSAAKTYVQIFNDENYVKNARNVTLGHIKASMTGAALGTAVRLVREICK